MNHARSQRGQTLPLITLFMFALLGMLVMNISFVQGIGLGGEWGGAVLMAVLLAGVLPSTPQSPVRNTGGEFMGIPAGGRSASAPRGVEPAAHLGLTHLED